MNNLGIGSWITRRRRTAPHRRALVFEDRAWTYGELGERIDRLTNALRQLGVRSGDRVGYLGANHPAFIELLFAAGSLGAIPLPINFRLPDDDVVYIVEDSGCRLLLSAPEAAETLGLLRTRTSVERYIAVGSTKDEGEAYEQLLAGSPAERVDVPVDQGEPGEVGEILVSGPNVMKGYWNRPEATAETMVAGRWLRTGDAARRDEEGYVYIVGRISDAYVADGRLIFPGDIERVLIDHPTVQDVAVIGVTDDSLGEAGVAFVVAASSAETTEEDLLAWTAEHLDRPEVLREIRFTDAIPRNPAGKVLRQTLRMLAEPGIGR